MNKYIRVILIILYISCLLLIYAVTVDKYDAVYEFDPSLPKGSLQNNDIGATKIFVSLLLFSIAVLQTLFYRFEKNKKWKKLVILMFLFALIFIFMRV